MVARQSNPPRPAVLLRTAVDVALVQVAIVLALLVRYFGVYAFENREQTLNLSEISARYLRIYLENTFSLTCLCLLALAIAGVYTRRRFYMGRFKALVVFQAISAAFLIYGALGYFFPRTIDSYDFPRIALVLAYSFTVAFLVGARLFIKVWQVANREPEAASKPAVVVEEEKRILVIGGAGYIGSALVPQLLEAGRRVRILDLMLFGDESLDPVKNHENLEIVQGDLRHLEYIVPAMRNVDAVVHLAGIVGDPACNLDERLTIDVNLTSTRFIAELAKSMGVRRFVFASTCSVYGACREMLDEKSEPRPVSLYGRTKLASEDLLRKLADSDFSPTIMRFATIFGLSGRTRFDLVVNLLAAKAKLEGKITVFNGEQWRPFVHVVDAATAIKLALEAPVEVVHNQIFNAGSSDQNYTILGIGELIHQQVIGAELMVDQAQTDTRDYRIDFSKIREYLGFAPQWTVEQGIQQVLDAIASGEVSDYRDPKYSNYEFLNLQGTTELARDHWAVELIRDLESV